MAANFNELIAEKTQEEYSFELKTKMTTAPRNVPVNTWVEETNPGLGLTETSAELLADERRTQIKIAQSLFLKTAEGVGLRLLIESRYDEQITEPEFTQGNFTLTNVAGGQTWNFAAGDLIIGTIGNNSILFHNMTGGTLLPNGTLEILVECFSPGSIGNIPNNSILELKTSLPGVGVNNDEAPGDNWITKSGSDGVDDVLARERARNKWDTLGTGSTSGALSYWVTSTPAGYTSTPVTYYRIMECFYLGTYFPMAATIILGADTVSGALTPADKAAVISLTQNKFFDPVRLQFTDMAFLDMPVAANVEVYTSSGWTETQAIAAMQNSLADYQRYVKIGQVVDPSKVGARIEDASKLFVKKFLVTAPAVPVVPLYYQRIRFTVAPGAIVVKFVQG